MIFIMMSPRYENDEQNANLKITSIITYICNNMFIYGLQRYVYPYCGLFMSGKAIVLIYIDDILFYSPKKDWIDRSIRRIEREVESWKLKTALLGSCVFTLSKMKMIEQ